MVAKRHIYDARRIQCKFNKWTTYDDNVLDVVHNVNPPFQVHWVRLERLRTPNSSREFQETKQTMGVFQLQYS